MHRIAKNIFIIIMVPTIIWGIIAFWHYQYLNLQYPGLAGFRDPAVQFPFWVVNIIILIGYIVTMVILYLIIYKKEFEEEYWKKQ
jgi:hypothetical protein